MCVMVQLIERLLAVLEFNETFSTITKLQSYIQQNTLALASIVDTLIKATALLKPVSYLSLLLY